MEFASVSENLIISKQRPPSLLSIEVVLLSQELCGRGCLSAKSCVMTLDVVYVTHARPCDCFLSACSFSR